MGTILGMMNLVILNFITSANPHNKYPKSQSSNSNSIYIEYNHSEIVMTQTEFQEYLHQSTFSQDELLCVLISANIKTSLERPNRKQIIDIISSEIWKSSHTPLESLIRPHILREISFSWKTY